MSSQSHETALLCLGWSCTWGGGIPRNEGYIYIYTRTHTHTRHTNIIDQWNMLKCLNLMSQFSVLKKGWFSDRVAEGSLRAARTLTHLMVVLVLRLLYKQIINHIYNNKLKWSLHASLTIDQSTKYAVKIIPNEEYYCRSLFKSQAQAIGTPARELLAFRLFMFMALAKSLRYFAQWIDFIWPSNGMAACAWLS